LEHQGVDTFSTAKLDMSLLSPSEEMVVTKGLPNNKTRKWYSFGSCAATYEYVVHNASLKNLVRGLVERVFCVVKDGVLTRPVRPKKNHFSDKLEEVGRKISSIISFCPSMTRHEFVNSYAGKRREVYEKARLSLEVLPLSRRDAYLSTFVKAEKINITLKPDPVPRIIQPRDPRYNVEIGKYLKKLEPKLMKAIDELYGEVTAIKGYTVERVGRILQQKRDKYGDPAFVCLDASRFDQHCSVDALEWEHRVYNRVFRCSYLAELLTWQVHNRGSAYMKDGRVKYKVDGCRMSGDMNTSMGNYLIMSALCYQYLKDAGINASLANCGDDCVLVLERSDLKKLKSLPSWFLKMGYSMKVEKPVFDLEKVEFCQMRPVLTSRGYIMVRRPDVVVTKDVCVVRGGMTYQKLEQWFHAQRDGGLALCGDVPVLSSFYKCFPAGDSGGVESEYSAPHKFKSDRQYGGIGYEARYSFWLAFGLTPDEQLALESELIRFRFNLEAGTPYVGASLFDYCTR
jgi:hypothetical protein